MSLWVELAAVFVLRALQAAVLCLPTLLCGMAVAGILRAIVGRVNVRRWLGQGSAGDLLRAWGLALLLPVCSFGVLPVIVTLRTMGIRWGPLVVMAIAGPLVAPWTIGYMIDRTGPTAFLLLVVSNAMIALTVGFMVDRSAPVDPPAGKDAPELLPTRWPLLNTLWSAGAALNRRVLALIGIGLLGVGAIAVCIPSNAVGEWLVERNAACAAIVAAIPLLTYVTPEIAAMQAGEVVHSSLMPGLIVPLIGLGAAIHLGTFIGFGRAVGIKRLFWVLGVIVFMTVIWGVAIDAMVYDGSYQPEDSHAFEDYGRPYHLLDHPGGAVAGFIDRFRRPIGMNCVAAGVAILFVVGVHVFIGRRKGLAADKEPRFISHRRARLAIGIIVSATIVLAVYTYYPPPSELKRELLALSAEFGVLYRTGDVSDAQRLIGRIDQRLSQFSRSAMLHGQFPTAEQYAMVTDIRNCMNEAMADSRDVESTHATSLRIQTKLRDFTRALE